MIKYPNTNGGYGEGNSFETVYKLCRNSIILEGFVTDGGREKEGKLLVIKGERRNEAEEKVKDWSVLSKIKY